MILNHKINKCIQQYHNGLLYKHLRITTTMEILQRNYYFPRMKHHVTEYITKCTQCQRNKHLIHSMYNKTQMMELLDIPWEEITMDFIMKLPKSKDFTTRILYNSIMVVVNKLTKYIHFISFKETFNTKQLKHLFFDWIIWYQNVPQSIINDKNKFFTSTYWTTLMKKIDVKLKLLIIYHPQTNSQIEWNNQMLKQYLWHFITMQQNN